MDNIFEFWFVFLIEISNNEKREKSIMITSAKYAFVNLILLWA